MPANYPFDPTGTAPSNLVVHEPHVINAHMFRNFYIIVPVFAPFYTTNLVIKYKDQFDVVRVMVEDVDFTLALPYMGATRGTGLPVYGAITFNDLTLDGVIDLQYQTIGGEWVCDSNYVLDVLATKAYNPRLIVWDVVTDKPSCFPPIVHYAPYDDITGQAEVVTALFSIRDAITNKMPIDYLHPHLFDYTNPHRTTKAQVSLGLVENYPVATAEDVYLMRPVDKYITLRQLYIALYVRFMLTPDGGLVFAHQVPAIYAEDDYPISITTLGVAEATDIRWRIVHVTTVPSDFVAETGVCTILGGGATFIIHPLWTPSGEKSFYIQLELLDGTRVHYSRGYILRQIDMVIDPPILGTTYDRYLGYYGKADRLYVSRYYHRPMPMLYKYHYTVV